MDNNQIDLSWLWASLSAAGSAIVTYFATRKKQDAEIKTSELDNVEKAVAIWRSIASDLEGKFNAMQAQMLELHKKNVELEVQLQSVTAKNQELQEEINDLRKQIKP